MFSAPVSKPFCFCNSNKPLACGIITFYLPSRIFLQESEAAMLSILSKMLGKETHSFLNVFHWILAQESHSGTSPAQPAVVEQLRINQASLFREGCPSSVFIPHHSWNTYSLSAITEECFSLWQCPLSEGTDSPPTQPSQAPRPAGWPLSVFLTC